MAQYRKKGKAGLILALVAAAEFILLIVFAIIVSGISDGAISKMSEMTAQAEVVNTYVNKPDSILAEYHVRFRFRDGVEKNFEIDVEWYEAFQEIQNGTLFYKEYLPNTLDSEYSREFVRFEKTAPG